MGHFPEVSGGGLCGFLDFAALDASGADANALGCAFDYRMYGLQIQIPAPFRQVVGVADTVSEPWAALTDFTHFRHIRGLLLMDSYELSTAGISAFTGPEPA
jgi:hypothetical protein